MSGTSGTGTVPSPIGGQPIRYWTDALTFVESKDNAGKKTLDATVLVACKSFGMDAGELYPERSILVKASGTSKIEIKRDLEKNIADCIFVSEQAQNKLHEKRDHSCEDKALANLASNSVYQASKNSHQLLAPEEGYSYMKFDVKDEKGKVVQVKKYYKDGQVNAWVKIEGYGVIKFTGKGRNEEKATKDMESKIHKFVILTEEAIKKLPEEISKEEQVVLNSEAHRTLGRAHDMTTHQSPDLGIKRMAARQSPEDYGEYTDSKPPTGE